MIIKITMDEELKNLACHLMNNFCIRAGGKDFHYSSPRIGFKEQTQKYRFVIKEKETAYMPHNKDNSIKYRNTLKNLYLE